MPNAEHTARMLKLEADMEQAEHIEWYATHHYIYDTDERKLIGECDSPARAAQIVREHNSHKALVKALGDAETAILDAMHAGNLSRAYSNGAIGKIEAALALAEVKP